MSSISLAYQTVSKVTTSLEVSCWLARATPTASELKKDIAQSSGKNHPRPPPTHLGLWQELPLVLGPMAAISALIPMFTSPTWAPMALLGSLFYPPPPQLKHFKTKCVELVLELNKGQQEQFLRHLYVSKDKLKSHSVWSVWSDLNFQLPNDQGANNFASLGFENKRMLTLWHDDMMPLMN